MMKMTKVFFCVFAAACLLSGCMTDETVKRSASDARIELVNGSEGTVRLLSSSSLIDDNGFLTVNAQILLSRTSSFKWIFCGDSKQTLYYRMDWLDRNGKICASKVSEVAVMPGNIVDFQGVASSERFLSYKLTVSLEKLEPSKVAAPARKAAVKKAAPAKKAAVKKAAPARKAAVKKAAPAKKAAVKKAAPAKKAAVKKAAPARKAAVKKAAPAKKAAVKKAAPAKKAVVKKAAPAKKAAVKKAAPARKAAVKKAAPAKKAAVKKAAPAKKAAVKKAADGKLTEPFN